MSTAAFQPSPLKSLILRFGIVVGWLVGVSAPILTHASTESAAADQNLAAHVFESVLLAPTEMVVTKDRSSGEVPFGSSLRCLTLGSCLPALGKFLRTAESSFDGHERSLVQLHVRLQI